MVGGREVNLNLDNVFKNTGFFFDVTPMSRVHQETDTVSMFSRSQHLLGVTWGVEMLLNRFILLILVIHVFVHVCVCWYGNEAPSRVLIFTKDQE